MKKVLFANPGFPCLGNTYSVMLAYQTCFYHLSKNLIVQKVRGMKSGMKSEYSFFCWKRGKVGGFWESVLKEKCPPFCIDGTLMHLKQIALLKHILSDSKIDFSKEPLFHLPI